MTDASRGQASPQHSLFGRSPQELLSEFPGQVPPPLQQIVAYLRRSDSFPEDPALFSVQSLAEKAFSEHIQDQTLVGLAQNKQEFHKYLRNPEAFPDPDRVQTARLFAQLLGRYLRSLPGLLISRHTSEIVARKVMKEVVNAEKKGEVTNSVALSERIHNIINQTQTQADVHTLRFLLKFFGDHVRSAAVFGSITPIDVAENVHEWIFNT